MENASAPHLKVPLWRRLLWFAFLWTGSVLILGIAAWALRAWLTAG